MAPSARGPHLDQSSGDLCACSPCPERKPRGAGIMVQVPFLAPSTDRETPEKPDGLARVFLRRRLPGAHDDLFHIILSNFTGGTRGLDPGRLALRLFGARDVVEARGPREGFPCGAQEGGHGVASRLDHATRKSTPRGCPFACDGADGASLALPDGVESVCGERLARSPCYILGLPAATISFKQRDALCVEAVNPHGQRLLGAITIAQTLQDCA